MGAQTRAGQRTTSLRIAEKAPALIRKWFTHKTVAVFETASASKFNKAASLLNKSFCNHFKTNHLRSHDFNKFQQTLEIRFGTRGVGGSNPSAPTILDF